MSSYSSVNPQSDGSNNMKQQTCACHLNRPESLRYVAYEYACIVHAQQNQSPPNLPALRRGRSLVFGMDRPADWDNLDATARQTRRREVLTDLIGAQHLWFEEDSSLIRDGTKITVWRNDYYGSFEVVEHEEFDEYLRIGHTFIRALTTMTQAEIDNLSVNEAKYFHEAFAEREQFWQSFARRPLKMAIHGRVQPSSISPADIQKALRRIDGDQKLPPAYTDRILHLCRTRRNLQPQAPPNGPGYGSGPALLNSHINNTRSIAPTTSATPAASRGAFPPAAPAGWVTGPHLTYDENGTASIVGLRPKLSQTPGKPVHRTPAITLSPPVRSEPTMPVVVLAGQPPNAPGRVRYAIGSSPSPGPFQLSRQSNPVLTACMPAEAFQAASVMRASSPPASPQHVHSSTPGPLQQSRPATPVSTVRMSVETTAGAAIVRSRSGSPLIASYNVPRQGSASSSSASRATTPSQQSQHDENVAFGHSLFPDRATLSRSSSPAVWNDESTGDTIRRDPVTGQLMMD